MRTRDKQRLKRAVQRGVAYLDANPDKEEAFEDWYRRVNVNYLRMSSGSYCIIGQTLGDYANLTRVDDFESWTSERLNGWASRHGFVVNDRSMNHYRIDHQWRDDAYALLGHLWTEAVEAREQAHRLTEAVLVTSGRLPAES